MEETITVVISQEDTDGTSITRRNSSMIELETAIGGVLHIQDVQEGVQNHVPTSESNEICFREKDKICPVLNIHQTSDCSTNTTGSLTKSATFPSSGKTLKSEMYGRDEVLNGAMYGQSSLKYGQSSLKNPCTRSMSMPTPLRLVSAMKGGREQQGTPRMVKLNVTWAADVYDPPATSLSHTVKSHNQRSKANKRKDRKHRHNKGKSSRGSSSEKKHHVSRRSLDSSSNDLKQLRSQASNNRSLLVDDIDQPSEEVISSVASPSNVLLLLDDFDKKRSEVVSNMKVAELSVGGQDSKCGSSFRASLAKVHVSIAEAT